MSGQLPVSTKRNQVGDVIGFWYIKHPGDDSKYVDILDIKESTEMELAQEILQADLEELKKERNEVSKRIERICNIMCSINQEKSKREKSVKSSG